ncbi:MAG TPA: chorismate synthase [Gaiellales bacterium]|nr:chorismate synthase [Gaiellales bacterium]
MELSYVTAGESHGPGLTVVISGVPAGLELDHELIRRDLARRQAGYGRSPRQKLETDDVVATGGLRHGRALGSPIAFFIENRDHRNWTAPMSPWPVDEGALEEFGWRGKPIRLPRPGHADLAGTLKYAHDDVRNVLERASARETAARVAAGAVAKAICRAIGIEVRSHVLQIGSVRATPPAWLTIADFDRAEASEVRCLDPGAERAMIDEIEAAKSDRDTLGGVTEVRAFGVPPGLGSHVSAAGRLDGRLAAAMLSIQSAKGVEIGDAIASAGRRGSSVHDEIHHADGRGFYRETDRAGGLEGGMTNGSDLIVRVIWKPLPTLMRPLQSVELGTHEPQAAHVERSDVTVLPAAAVVAEAGVAFELARAALEKFGGDAIGDLVEAHRAYMARVAGA